MDKAETFLKVFLITPVTLFLWLNNQSNFQNCVGNLDYIKLYRTLATGRWFSPGTLVTSATGRWFSPGTLVTSATGLWFYPGTLVTSNNKTDHHNIANIVESGFKHHKLKLNLQKRSREHTFTSLYSLSHIQSNLY